MLKKTNKLACLLCLATVLILSPLPGFAEDLMQVYEVALQSDPEIKRAEAARLASQEAGPQSTARFLPSIFFSADLTSQSRDLTSFSPAFGDSNTDFTSNGYNLNLAQPLFHYDAFKQSTQADAIIAQADIDYAVVQQDLILRVAQRYFEVLDAQDNLVFAQSEKESIGRQLEQTKQRFNVGLIAITDVHEAQSRFDLSIANEIDAENRVANAHESLRELTGQYFESLATISDKARLVKPSPADIEKWNEMAQNQNLRLTSARFSVDIARSFVDIQKSPHYPTVDLVGNYRFSDDSESPNFATESTDTSVSLQFNWSLYEGSVVNSRTREAEFQHTQTLQILEIQRRATERGVRDAYLAVLANISRIRALKQAVISQQSALDATEAGFEVGTRTTVDVLNARTLLFRSQRDFTSSKYSYLLSSLGLKQQAGTLTTVDLKMINDWLQ